MRFFVVFLIVCISVAAQADNSPHLLLSCLEDSAADLERCAGLDELLAAIESSAESVPVICLDGTFAGGDECNLLGGNAILLDTSTPGEGFYDGLAAVRFAK